MSHYVGAYRLQVGIFSLAATLFLLLGVVKSQRLFFVWEEWGQLWDAVRKPVWGLFQSHFGYMDPLNRLLFTTEAKIFGSWYTGYVVINSLLIIGFTFLLWREFRAQSISSQYIALSGSIIFMFSAGVVFAANFAAMAGYILCWLAGIFAIIAWRRTGRIVFPSLILLIGALSNNLMNVTVTAFVVAVVVARSPNIKSALKPAAIIGVVGFSASAIMLFIARFLPATDTAVSSSQSLTVTSFAEILDHILQMFALLATWIGAPFLGPLVVDQSLYSRTVIGFMDYPVLLGIFLIAAITALGFSVGRSGSRLFFAMFFSMALFALQVAFFRGEQGFEVRYTLMWLPSVIVLWALWSIPQPSVSHRWLRAAAAAVLSISAPIVVATSIASADQSIDIVRPRTTLSEELKAGVERCGTPEQPTRQSELTPSMTWEDVCEAASFLR
jgi:hypothetical protein